MKKVKISFSLDEYNKGGYEVETRDGSPARIVATDAKGERPIVALIERGGKYYDKYESTAFFYENGEVRLLNEGSTDDIFLTKVEFEDGDIVYTKNSVVEMISIFKNFWSDSNKTIRYHANIGNDGELGINSVCDAYNIRLATDEEKKRLFDALAKNGKRWNDETKDFESIEDEKETNWVSSGIISTNEVIFRKEENGLRRGCFVLARDGKDQSWELDIFGRHDNEYTGGYTCVGGCYDYCIPFDSETEHLHGTTEDCPSKYKAWKD